MATACLASRIFGERIHRVYTQSYAYAGYLLNLSAFLHDVGKSSNYYQQRVKGLREGNSLSFWLHHVVSSHILMIANTHIPGNDDVLRLASYVVLRHHQAMESTQNICNGNEWRNYYINVVKELNTEWIREILNKGVAGVMINKEHSEAILKAVTEVKEKAIQNKTSDVEIVPYNLVCRSIAITEKPYLKRLVISITGAVVVSDIVVSTLSRGGRNLLAEIWMRELPHLRSQAEDCIKEAGVANHTQ